MRRRRKSDQEVIDGQECGVVRGSTSRSSTSTTSSRLVELLADRESIDDETFAEVALEGRSSSAPAQWPRSQPAAAPPGWTESAESRFERGEWGERSCSCARSRRATRTVIPPVLANAEEDWSGSPLAREVSRFLEARVAAGERLTLERARRARRRPAAAHPRADRRDGRRDEGSAPARTRAVADDDRSTSTSSASSGVSSIRRSGRPATLVGSRIAAVDALVGALSASRPRSVLRRRRARASARRR